ncbi:O-antigen ligase family protein [Alloalcanivorax gelatiniphagus]|uniref:O-antigen ligase family protein n=1 Tax=Alloalcanivorax gelatiniphagus TaxID=1194167 RepID=A0ABY2XKK6_9GAMM|nr:O-antigen ligase family protein [Alloalcanivorax gelatiniphagus]TMW11735.1 O-antigen ligase family protein [Alloalcanivorax gelatiniphagus]
MNSPTPSTAPRECLITAWLGLSMVVMFSGLLVFPSRTSLMNALDAVFFLPALIVVLVAARHRPLELVTRWPLLWIFLLYATLSTFYSPAPNPSRFVRALLELFTLFSAFELFVRRYPRAFWRAMLIGTAGAALAAAVDFYAYYFIVGRPFDNQLYGVFERFEIAPWLILDTNQLYASMYCITLPFFAFFASRQLPPARWVRVLPWLTSITLLVYLAANQRRSTLVALAVGCVALPILTGTRRLLIPLAVLALVLGTIVAVDPEIITERGASERPALWAASWETIKEAPVFGHGMANRSVDLHITNAEGKPVVHDHPHNYYLSLLYFLGFTGLLLWTLLWLPAALRAMAHYRHRTVLLLAAMATGFSAVLFDGIHPYTPFLYNWPSVWIPMALLVAVVHQLNSDPAGVPR